MPPQRKLTERCVWAARCFVVVLIANACGVGVAADTNVETLLSDLHLPRGVAVRPESSGSPIEVFVAESGAGRVVRWAADAKDAVDEVVGGFPRSEVERPSEASDIGARALFFLDHNRLVVAGGQEDRTPFLWLYDLSDADESVKAEDRKQEAAMRGTNSDSKRFACVSLARTLPNDRVADLLYAVASDGAGSGTLWRVPIHANTLGETALLVTSGSTEKPRAAGGIAVSKEGYIVVASRDREEAGEHGTLKYLSPLDNRTVLEVPTKLRHVTALAFGPKSGNLFAANMAASEKGGGIYRIDDASEPGNPNSEAVKIAPIANATSLAFGPDGGLYVTALGDSTGKKNSGVLLKLSGDL